MFGRGHSLTKSIPLGRNDMVIGCRAPKIPPLISGVRGYHRALAGGAAHAAWQHRRASAVADALFRESCVGVVACNGRMPNPAGLGDGVENGFVALQSTGFHAPLVNEWQATLLSRS